MGYFVGTLALDTLLLVAVLSAYAYPIRFGLKGKSRRSFWLVWVLFLAHMLEEGLTGFPRVWPSMLGFEPWHPAFFIVLNGFWLCVWIWAAHWGKHQPRIASIALWFMALGCGLNAIAHPALALYVGHYFPGLVSGPILGLLGWRWFSQIDFDSEG
ncbi:MAG: hypothetical protein H6510_14860 [Acidobacteria bacterium]|nr:hypothetical protein [Acidobacteriota bacterium]